MLCIKNPSALSLMAQSGKLLAECMQMLGESLRPGMTTLEIDKLAHRFITAHGAKPSFLGLYGFPATLCISVNEQVIHGIPSANKVIHEGDLVSLDGGVLWKGFHSDMARTFIIGETTEEKRLLVERTREAFYAGMNMAREGNRVSDISHAVEAYIKPFGYGIVRDYTGHGVGRELHESPEIPNFGAPGHGVRIVNGMTLAIEPMINLGTERVRVLSDKWTTVTCDGSPSAHWENTVAVVDGAPVILTDPNGSL
ncbi:MAG: type I methionyl aminopeptidase [Clostridia bacterium]|nr:type I methionyl aminopeptidase [Clostridia bacterium]